MLGVAPCYIVFTIVVSPVADSALARASHCPGPSGRTAVGGGNSGHITVSVVRLQPGENDSEDTRQDTEQLHSHRPA